MRRADEESEPGAEDVPGVETAATAGVDEPQVIDEPRVMSGPRSELGADPRPATAEDPAGSTATPGAEPRPGPVRTRRSLPLLVLAALGVALVFVGVAIWLGSDRTEPRAEATAGINRLVNQDAGSLNAHNSPTVVASPVNPNLLVVAGRIDRPQLGASVHVSRDAGESWADVPLNLPPGANRAFTPDVAFDGKGTLHVLFATVDGDAPANYPGGLWLERWSADGVFSPPVRIAGPFTFQPRLAVNPRTNQVHVTWVQASQAVIQELAAVVGPAASEDRNPGFGPPPNPVVMSTSEDGGVTFSAPTEVSDRSQVRVGAPTPVVGSGNDVFVLYEDFQDDVTDFEGRKGPVHPGRFSLVLARSTDGGRSFPTRSVVEPQVVPSERFLAYLPKAPSLAIDPRDGALYVAWSDARNRDVDVFVRRSDNDGASWSDRVRVNDDRTNRDQYLPQVAVSPDGRVDIVYLDRRQDPGNVLTRSSLASSFDRGKTWTSLAVSDGLFDSRVGPRNDQTNPDSGSRLGLVSARDAAHVVWADTRRASPDSDSQDLVAATVRFNPR